MLRAAFKNVFAHKLRMALATLAVVFGVGFVSGTYLLTDTLNASFTSLFGDVYKNVSVDVRGVAHLSDGDGGDGSAARSSVRAAVLEQVRAVPGVTEAQGTVSGYAQLIDPTTGKAITTSGAPTQGVSWTGSSISTARIVDGHAPTGPTEVVIDQHTATTHQIHVGQQISVVTRDGIHPETLVGLFRLGGTGSLGGATFTAFDPSTAQRLLGEPGKYASIEVAAAAGVSQSELRSRVAHVLPAGYEAITGKQLADENAGQIQQGIGFLNKALLVFAGVALFVGTFIIFNTFSMLVAQRTRELALFRALGASRRQVTRSVLVEALVTGVVASTLGLGFGYLVALLLQSVLGATIGLPGGSLVFLPRTVVASYAVGVVVTLVSAYVPARRAARIAPVAAMRDDVTLPSRSLLQRAVVAGALTAVGAALMAAGLVGASNGALLVGVGVALVFLGVAGLSPLISRPVVGLLGAPLPRLFGVPGRLGRQNTLRSPRRTAATASALMIGVALVAAMGTLGASLTASTSRLVDRSLGADIVVTSVSRSSEGGLPASVAAKARQTEGVSSVTELRTGPVQIDGRSARVVAVTATSGKESLGLQAVAGNLATLGSGQLAVSTDVADARHWRVGQVLPVVFGRTGEKDLTLGATYQKNQLAGGYVLGLDTFAQNFGGSRLDDAVLVSVADGEDVKAVHQRIDQATQALPTVKVQDQTEFKDAAVAQVNNIVNFIYALLAMSIIIAVLGIVNTLALSVFERTREIGLLRAVGLSRAQLRRTITLESTVIAVFGAVLGIALGIVFGWALQQALASQGVEVLSFPVGTLVATLVLSGVVGVLAAVWPAFRASRMNVLSVIASD